MVRRRTVTLSLSAVALVVAAPSITSCAEHPGAAAVVGGRSISVAGLQGDVTRLRSAAAATGQNADEASDVAGRPGGLSRLVLTGLVLNDVTDRAAARHHVTVTRGETEAAEAAAEQRFGGRQALDQALTQAQVTPGAAEDAFFRMNLQYSGIAAAIGADLSTRRGAAAVDSELSRTARTLRVEVNPRYGTWNSAARAVTGTTARRLSRAAEPAPGADQPSVTTG